MSLRVDEHVSAEAFGTRPRNYGHLQGLAARYAQDRLAGGSVINRATRKAIQIDWPEGLRGATAPGTAPELLFSLFALPGLLAQARYLGVNEAPRKRPNVVSCIVLVPRQLSPAGR